MNRHPRHRSPADLRPVFLLAPSTSLAAIAIGLAGGASGGPPHRPAGRGLEQSAFRMQEGMTVLTAITDHRSLAARLAPSSRRLPSVGRIATIVASAVIVAVLIGLVVAATLGLGASALPGVGPDRAPAAVPAS